MQPDLLQQLRDLQLPANPTWWPPAPGWWLVAALLLALGWLGVGIALRAYRRRRPIRRARQLHTELWARYQAGELDDRGYVDGCNELLKRLMIHGLGIDAARRASDQPWLQLLDQALGEPAFTQGPGRMLGEHRFRPAPVADPAALAALVSRLLARISPGLGARLS